MVRQVVKKKFLEGIKVGAKEIEVNMLKFEYGTIFSCEENIQNILIIKSILRCFELADELKKLISLKVKLG